MDDWQILEKQMINKETQVLFKLLRLALGTEPRKYFGEPVEPFPDNIDWNEVIRLSYKHKVSVLAVDGLKSSGYNIYNGLDKRQTIQLQKTLEPWFDDVLKTEHSYAYYKEVLNTLCQLFIANGLKPIILKGYGLSLNYPNPNHRGLGDIDIFLIDEKGKPGTDRGVEIVEKVFGIKTNKVPHDYEFEFKGIEIELHYDTTNAHWNTNSEKYIVNRLNELLLQNPTPCPGIDGALLPSSNFNAVYLMRHKYGHFYTSTSNIRQYVDWMQFLRMHSQEIDWFLIDKEWQLSNMKLFANSIIGYLEETLGLNHCYCPIYESNPIVKQFVINDMFNPVERGESKFQHFTYYYRNRWKHQFLTGENWMTAIIKSIGQRIN